MEINGGPFSLLRALLGDSEALARARQIELQGDAELAQQFSTLASMASPDIEELLSRAVGDVAAHQAGEASRGLAQWVTRARVSIDRSLSEFLQEERRDLPTRFEVEEFLVDVDELSSDVERAAARLKRLQARAETS